MTAREAGRPLTVLIVDDSIVMRAVIRQTVLLSGANIDAVFEAPDGAAALAILETQSIDVVFTDLNMPVMNGIQLLREMTAREWTHIIRIVVSTDRSIVRRDEVAALGVMLVLEKPFAPEAIRDALHVSH